MNETVICQFAKWPDLGKVKTRLAKDLGKLRAQKIHIDLVLAVMDELQNHTQAEFQLWLSRNDTQLVSKQLENLSQELARFCHLLTQRQPSIEVQVSGDLGYKMQNAFERLASDYKKVIIVGSDCPSVTRAVVNDAIALLDHKDIVLSPAEDGGYVLIAAVADKIASLNSDWLSNVEWGSASVLSQTLEACTRNNLSVGMLEELWDVDELVDYQRWRSETCD